MKKTGIKGFTLIELIVVIAIIGVLAAILVPAMMGWVVKSRIATNNNNASEICTQLQSLLTDRESTGDPILENGTIVFKNHSFSGVDVTLTDSDKTALQQINDSLTDMTRVTWAAKVSNGYVVAVCLSGNDCKAVGGFPVQCPSGYDFRQPGGDIEDYIIYAEGNGSSWPSN